VADAITYKLTGDVAALRRLRALTPKLQRKGLRLAARRAMKIVQTAARANAKRIDDPQTANSVWRLIVIRAGRLREPGVLMRVGVLGGAVSSKDRDPPWYWRLIELGSERTRAQPFMRPALENNVAAVSDTVVRELNAELDKLMAEL
jgi:HK97 gp10 family phage protein